MQQVTVFGGSGFIGRHLIEHLAVAGASVRIAVRHPFEMAGFPNRARIQCVEADILDDKAVRAAIQGADTVINLVGILTQVGRQTFTAIHDEGVRGDLAERHDQARASGRFQGVHRGVREVRKVLFAQSRSR